MGSSSIVKTNKQYKEVPNWLQGQNSNVVNSIVNNASNWAKPVQGSLQSNVLNSALGNNLNSVNKKEQQLFNQQLDSANNSIMRQFAGAGRGNSFSNLKAINDNTSNLTNRFLSSNYDRNRNEMLNAQQQYFSNLALAQNQALGAIGQNTTHVGQQIEPGNSAFQNTLSGIGAVASLLSALNPLKG